MKVHYTKIRRVTPVFVDSYYGLTHRDFLDDDQCDQIDADHIREVIERGVFFKLLKKKMVSFYFCSLLYRRLGLRRI